jgi:hypothetical protein
VSLKIRGSTTPALGRERDDADDVVQAAANSRDFV